VDDDLGEILTRRRFIGLSFCDQRTCGGKWSNTIQALAARLERRLHQAKPARRLNCRQARDLTKPVIYA
jgi:hypothetical protein